MAAKIRRKRPGIRPVSQPAPADSEHAKRLKAHTKGIQCPWCPGLVPIHTCPHNPFMLMERVNKENHRRVQAELALARALDVTESLELRDEITRLKEQLEDSHMLCDILQRMANRGR